jgi:hypothetical protein
MRDIFNFNTNHTNANMHTYTRLPLIFGSEACCEYNRLCRSNTRRRGLALGESLTSLMAEHPHSRNVDLYM